MPAPFITPDAIYRLRLRLITAIPANQLAEENDDADPTYVVHCPPSNQADHPAYGSTGITFVQRRSAIHCRYAELPDSRFISRYFIFSYVEKEDAYYAFGLFSNKPTLFDSLTQEGENRKPIFKLANTPEIAQRFDQEYVAVDPSDILITSIGRNTVLLDRTDPSVLAITQEGDALTKVAHFQIGHPIVKGVTGLTVEQAIAATICHVDQGPLSQEMKFVTDKLLETMEFFDPNCYTQQP